MCSRPDAILSSSIVWEREQPYTGLVGPSHYSEREPSCFYFIRFTKEKALVVEYQYVGRLRNDDGCLLEEVLTEL